MPIPPGEKLSEIQLLFCEEITRDAKMKDQKFRKLEMGSPVGNIKDALLVEFLLK